MNLIITNWLLVYVLEHKHNFHFVIIFDLQCRLAGRLPTAVLQLALATSS